jgi:hypothetical protein
VPPPEIRTEAGHMILCHIPLDELMAVDPVVTGAAAE